MLPFPEHLVSLRQLMHELCALLEEGHRDTWYAFVHLSETHGTWIRAAVTEQVSVVRDRGLVMRIVAGGQSFEHATNALDPDLLRDDARALRARVEAAELPSDSPSFQPRSWAEEDLASLHPVMLQQIPAHPGPHTPIHFALRDAPDPSDKLLERARQIRSRVQAADQGNQLKLGYGMVRQHLTVSAFVDRHKDMSQSMLFSSVGGRSVSTGSSRFLQDVSAFGNLASISLSDAQIRMLVTLPQAIDQAERLEPGRYTVITGPQITGVLAHEAFGHTQEGDTRMLGRSCATELQASGRAVGSPQATILSNAAVYPVGQGPAQGGGTFFFDVEGQLARSHAILDRGRVSNPMNDLLSAMLGDAHGCYPRQANARRESWRRPVFARQTNTYFTPGEHSFDELITMVDYGFLAEWAAGGMEDPKGMSLTAGVLFLREIRDGALTGRLFVGPEGGQVELSDPVPQLLSGLRAKSRDLQLFEGGCNKYYKEILQVGIGGPHILWADVQCG